MKSHVNLVTFHHGDLEIAPTHEHTHEHTRKHALVTSHYVLLAVRKDTRLSPAKAAVNRSKTLFDASAVVAELAVDGSTEARNYARLLRAAARADDDVWPAKILNKLPPHFETEALRPTQDSLREAARQLVVAANEMARQERAREKLAKTCALAATAAARSAPAAAGGAEDEGLCFHVEPGSSEEENEDEEEDFEPDDVPYNLSRQVSAALYSPTTPLYSPTAPLYSPLQSPQTSMVFCTSPAT